MPRIWQWGEKTLIEWNELKPVLSIIFIVATLLGLVFLQMEERRLGYVTLKLSQKYKIKTDERRGLEIHLAQVTRLEKLESMASQKLTLRRAKNYQVIYLNEFTNLDDVRREFSAADHERLDMKPDIRPKIAPVPLVKVSGKSKAATPAVAEAAPKKMSLIARLTGYFPGASGEPR